MEEELLIPIVAIVCGAGLPMLLAIIASYMLIKSKHDEKMAMIEKGIILEEAALQERKPGRYNALRNGICMVGLSLGVIVGLLIDANLAYESNWSMLVVPTVTVMFGGVAFVVYFFLSRYLMEKESAEDEKKLRLGE